MRTHAKVMPQVFASQDVPVKHWAVLGRRIDCGLIEAAPPRAAEFVPVLGTMRLAEIRPSSFRRLGVVSPLEFPGLLSRRSAVINAPYMNFGVNGFSPGMTGSLLSGGDPVILFSAGPAAIQFSIPS